MDPTTHFCCFTLSHVLALIVFLLVALSPTRTRYHLKDVIVGKIYFLLVRIKIKHMELSIIRRETTGAAPNQYNESETITKFEIMDGAPVRGETIPIRLFLGGFELTPTFREGNPSAAPLLSYASKYESPICCLV